jgi:hypothetical protein
VLQDTNPAQDAASAGPLQQILLPLQVTSPVCDLLVQLLIPSAPDTQLPGSQAKDPACRHERPMLERHAACTSPNNASFKGWSMLHSGPGPLVIPWGPSAQCGRQSRHNCCCLLLCTPLHTPQGTHLVMSSCMRKCGRLLADRRAHPRLLSGLYAAKMLVLLQMTTYYCVSHPNILSAAANQKFALLSTTKLLS